MRHEVARRPLTSESAGYHGVELYFALRSGQDQHHLHPDQIKLYENPGYSPYLVYTEDVSKNNQGGMKHRRITPKQVSHYANMRSNPQWCFVWLYKRYCSLCSSDHPKDAFHLAAPQRPQLNCWYDKKPGGHNLRANTVRRLCQKAQIPGYKTNHSLWVTAATRLFQREVD